MEAFKRQMMQASAKQVAEQELAALAAADRCNRVRLKFGPPPVAPSACYGELSSTSPSIFHVEFTPGGVPGVPAAPLLCRLGLAVFHAAAL